jgi:hypothetical protein
MLHMKSEHLLALSIDRVVQISQHTSYTFRRFYCRIEIQRMHFLPGYLVPPLGPPFFGEKQGLWGDE